MKKVIFKEPELFATFADFDEMLQYAQNKSKCIGFIPKGYLFDKYMLILTGSAMGLAVNTTGTWVSKELQPFEEGEYFIFDSAAELYKWLSE